MKQLFYRVYAELDNNDIIALDEIMPGIKADNNTLEKVKATLKKNAEKIRTKKPPFDVDDTANIVRVSIVEILLTDDDIESEVIEEYSIEELANII